MIPLLLLLSVNAATALDLPTAVRLADAAVAACARRSIAVSASVVDAAGLPLATLRAPGSAKSPVAAPAKAAAAVHFDSPGSILEPREKTDPAFAQAIADANGAWNPHAGSLPLHRGDRLVGGLAVADTDHAIADTCAREALKTAPDLH